MAYLLALDSGTSSARAIVFDAAGKVQGIGRQAFQQYYPKPGWVEHDAEEIWRAQCAAVQGALMSAKVGPHHVASVGITNQRETSVLWDRKSGEPVGKAIVWQDRRTAQFCKAAENEGLSLWVRQKTGLVIDPYFSGTKIRWMLDHLPSARALAQQGRLAFGTVDTWLLWKLTDGRVHATDPSNASRTMLFNIHTLQWDAELLDWLGIPQSILPEVRPNAHLFGETTQFGKSMTIGGMAGDQQAATFGQACLRPGEVKNTYGTGCFLLMNTGQQPVESHHRLITTVGWQVDGQVTYALEGAIFSAGASVGWLQDVGLVHAPAEAETLAESVPDAGGVCFVPAFAGLGAPQWDPHARGTILGLSRGTTRAHLAKAALQAMAYQSDEVLQAMEKDAGLAIPTMRVDGGASLSNSLMQFQADLSGVRIQRPANVETTAWGAAKLAGIHAGVLDAHASGVPPTPEHTFTPTLTAHEREKLREQWQNAVKRSLNWAQPEA